MLRFLILSIGIGLAFGSVNFKDPLENRKELDQDATESETVQIVQPLTIAAAVHNEVQRLQSLQEVFPPRELSYFTPYGDRTIISLRFPSISKELLDKANKAGYGYGASDASNYGPPKNKYGPTKPKYGPPNQNPKKSTGDLGVIISQNYILRENIRDYFNFSKLANSRPSNEQVVELAKAFAERLNLDSGSSHHYGGSNSKTDGSQQSKSFVLVSIESRIRTSPESGRFGFVRGGGYTNGTIIFPSPNNPAVLTNIPFILRKCTDISSVFDGYQSNGLIPLEKTEIKNFLKIMCGINEDIHEEGRQEIETLRGLSARLERPRLPDFSLFEADALFEEEARARMTHWLYTSTVGIRVLPSSSSTENPQQNSYHQPQTTYQDPIPDNYNEGEQQSIRNSYNSDKTGDSYSVPPSLPSTSNQYQTLTAPLK